MKNFKAVLPFILLASWFMPDHVSAGAKSKHDIWPVNVHFIAGHKAYNARQTERWVRDQVAQAERLFAAKPRLKINYKIIRKTRAGGRNLASMTFKNKKKYRKFMDTHFDNAATSKTSGHLVVLLVDDICIKGKCAGGRAWFPHWVNPFSRKHGIFAVYNHSEPILAHELGHIFSLRHTFEKYTNPDPRLVCNKDYKPKGGKNGKGYCNSCRGTIQGKGVDKICRGNANVMDYCPAASYYVNACQQRRAANQRKTYMTKKGEVKYPRLKGGR